MARFTVLLSCWFLAVLLACAQPAPLTTSTVSPAPTAEIQAVTASILKQSPTRLPVTLTPEPTATTISTLTQTPLPTSTPKPASTQAAIPTATPTATPTLTPSPTVEPTATPVPAVRLVLTVEASAAGYWSDGTADLTLNVTLLNEGDLPDSTTKNVRLSCPTELKALSGCGEETILTLKGGYGPASDSFTLRLPMGVQTAVELNYSDGDAVTFDIDVPERILGVERDLFECYVDREPEPDPGLPGMYLYGCSGWATPTVEKWLNDVPIKVWTTGVPLYIEDLRTVLESLSPILGLNFVWVDSEQDADLKGYVGVKREDIAHLGFQPRTLDYGGFAGSSTTGGEVTSAYFVVWYIDEESPTSITFHEALHALVSVSHSTRPLSAVGGSGMALLSPQDEALFRLNSHPLVRPGMTMQEVESLIVFRDQLLDEPAPEPLTDPVQMVWRALVSLNEAGTASYRLSGGYTDRQCNQTFGVRRGPLQFRIGRFRLWKDDPALLYFHNHVNEFYIHYSGAAGEWRHHTRPLTGDEWKSLNKNELNDLTNWWIWNGKLHRSLRSILQDASPDDIAVDTTEDGSIELHVTMDDSYPHMYLWGDGWRVKSVDFTLTLNPDTFFIEGYRWVLRDNPPTDYPDYPCLTYEEVATDFQLGVELELPEEIPE